MSLISVHKYTKYSAHSPYLRKCNFISLEYNNNNVAEYDTLLSVYLQVCI